MPRWSMKREHARQFREEQKIKRPILLDDMTGTCHRAFGTLPNMTWLIGRGGLILYKAAWTRPDDVVAALDESWGGYQRRRQDDLMPAYSERMIWRAGRRRPFHRTLQTLRPPGHRGDVRQGGAGEGLRKRECHLKLFLLNQNT